MANHTNLKIVEKKCEDLIGAEYNPRELTEKQHRDLTDSLKRFGIVDPVLVNVHPDRKNIIVGGHQRTRVWQELGNKTISCVEVSLTLDQEKELNIRLNKNTGQFDFDMLANHFEQSDLFEFGFEENELGLFENIEDEIDKTEEGEEIEIDKSLQVLPKNEYIIITEKEGSIEWEELKTIFKCKKVRQGGCEKGSTSDKATTGLERVFNLKTFKERVGI